MTGFQDNSVLAVNNMLTVALTSGCFTSVLVADSGGSASISFQSSVQHSPSLNNSFDETALVQCQEQQHALDTTQCVSLYRLTPT